MDIWARLANSGVYLAVLAGGYLLKRGGMFHKDDARILSKIIMNITLPAAIIKGLMGVQFTSSLILACVSSFAVSLIMLGLGTFLSRKDSPAERCTFILSSNTFNYGNFALPFLAGVVSKDAFAAMCLFDVGVAMLTYGPNIAVAQHAMGSAGTGKTRITFTYVLKKMFTAPTFVVYMSVLALNLFHLSLPSFVMDVAVMAGNANAFLAMLCIGILFEIHVPKAGMSIVRRVFTMRYTICTIAACVVWFLLPYPRETARALVAMLFAPVASCSPILTLENGGDATVAAFINSVSIIVGIVLMTSIIVFLPV